MQAPTPPLVQGALAAAAVATVCVAACRPARPPSVRESVAALVLTAASYLLSPALPPSFALLFCALLLRTLPAAAERFTVAAPHAPEPHPGAPLGRSPPHEVRLGAYGGAPLPRARRPERALATAAMLHGAQSDEIP